MTEQLFWDKIKQLLDIPFDYYEVENIECDPTGCIYFDLKDGSTFYLAFNKSDLLDDWD